MTQYPALFNDFCSLIAVGAANSTFDIAPFSQLGDIWAPGQGIKYDPMPYFKLIEGTSVAAATVSGLAAYLLSIDAVPWQPSSVTGYRMREKLRELSFPRKEGGPPIVSNGLFPGTSNSAGDSDPAQASLVPIPSLSSSSPIAANSLPPPPPFTLPSSFIPIKSTYCTDLKTSGWNLCGLATAQFGDDFIYTAYTSYVSVVTKKKKKKNTSLGCEAVYICDEAQDYKAGLSGSNIKKALGISKDPVMGVPVCGIVELGRSCRVFLNECIGTGCNFVAQAGAPPPSRV